jgi:hypothetical protein
MMQYTDVSWRCHVNLCHLNYFLLLDPKSIINRDLMKIVCCENKCLTHIILKSTENRGFRPDETNSLCDEKRTSDVAYAVIVFHGLIKGEKRKVGTS